MGDSENAQSAGLLRDYEKWRSSELGRIADRIEEEGIIALVEPWAKLQAESAVSHSRQAFAGMRRPLAADLVESHHNIARLLPYTHGKRVQLAIR